MLVPRPLLGSDAGVNVGPRCIPSDHLAPLVSEWVVTNQEPAILAVLPASPMLEFERKTTRESSLSLVSEFFEVLRMKDSLPKIWRNHIVSSKARIVESTLIRVDRYATELLHNYRLRYSVRDLSKLAFILTQSLLN